MRTLRIGTRGSALAVAQTQLIADQLAAAGASVEIVTVSTAGDRSSRPVAEIGVGVFTSALRDALADGEVDVAIHSMKDLPTAPDPRLSLAAVPLREDPRDALVARDGLTLGELPAGARVGTGAARRSAQLRALGFDLEVVPIRGNADTRLRKVTDGDFDAIVLAFAGLERIDRLEAVAEVFDPVQMLPAPGQGALAVECRADRTDLVEILATLDDPASRTAVTAERALLAELEAGCSAPVGAYAALEDRTLHLIGVVAGYDGERQVRLSINGHPDEAERLGRDLAARMIAEGADQLMGERTS